MLTPPMAAEGSPTLPLPPDIPLFIAEERAHGWATMYRDTVVSMGTRSAEAVLNVDHTLERFVAVH
jgi:hypothetical protein